MYEKNADGKKPLETLLKESLTVNPISSRQNLVKRSFTQNRSPPYNTSIKTPPYKGKLIKSSLKSIKLDIENKTKNVLKATPKVDKKKQTTINFIEKLREIENNLDKDNFLDQTNEEIDIASRQLQEIQKLLMSRKQRSPKKEKNSKSNYNRHQHEHSFMHRVNEQLDRMRKKYLHKTKVHYKSVKDFENFTNEESINIPKKNQQTCPSDEEVKIYWTKNKALTAGNKTDLENQEVPNPRRRMYNKFSLSAGRKIPEIDKKVQEPTSLNITRRKSIVGVRFKEAPDYISSSESENYQESSESEIEYSDEIYIDKHIFSKRRANIQNKSSENDPKNMKEKDNEKEFSEENGKKKPWFETDLMLRDSILKSNYLSKEFPIDFADDFLKVDNTASKKRSSMQLLGTTRPKFQDRQTCREANLKRRDQKLYTALNVALKNTIFDEIQE